MRNRVHLLPFAWALGLLAGLFSSIDPLQAATRVFYDGSEAGNTQLWANDGSRNRCTSVGVSSDGVAGPYVPGIEERRSDHLRILLGFCERRQHGFVEQMGHSCRVLQCNDSTAEGMA